MKTAPYTGTVYFNGRPRDRTFRLISSYVPQEDISFEHCTVREIVQFHMKLKADAPTDAPPELLQTECERILSDLGLKHVADTKFGGETVRGLSGGQRRRVTFCKTRVDHGEIHAAAFSVLTRRIVPVINGSGGAGPRCRRDVDARLEFIDITQADRDKHSIKRPSLPGPGSRSCAPSSSRSPRRAASRASAIESRSRRPIASGRGRTRTCASRG